MNSSFCHVSRAQSAIAASLTACLCLEIPLSGYGAFAWGSQNLCDWARQCSTASRCNKFRSKVLGPIVSGLIATGIPHFSIPTSSGLPILGPIPVCLFSLLYRIVFTPRLIKATPAVISDDCSHVSQFAQHSERELNLLLLLLPTSLSVVILYPVFLHDNPTTDRRPEKHFYVQNKWLQQSATYLAETRIVVARCQATGPQTREGYQEILPVRAHQIKQRPEIHHPCALHEALHLFPLSRDQERIARNLVQQEILL
jgi:hypothetical protein